MDKARRHELKMLRYKRRLDKYGFKPAKWTHVYRTTGNPCSCAMCSPYKYDRAKMKRDIDAG